MTKNVYDQFDAPAPAAPAPAGGNVYDQFDDGKEIEAPPPKNAFGARMPTQDELVPVEGYEAPKPKSGERDALTATTDTLKSFAKGSGSLVKGIGWLINSKELEEVGKRAEEYWSSSQSDYLKDKIAKVEQAEGFIGTLSAYIDNPAALADVIVQSIPMMVAGMGAGAVGARAAGAIAYRLSLRAGATAEVAAAAAQKAALRTAIGVNIAGEGAISGGATGSDVEAFAKSKGATDEQARSMANEAALKAGLWTAAGATLGAGFESRAMLGQMTDMGMKGFAKAVGKGAGEEMIQNPGENYVAYEQKVKLDPEQKFDLGGSIAEGMLTGGVMGAGLHVVGAVSSKADQRKQIDTKPVSPDAEISMSDVVGGKPAPEEPKQAEIRTDSPDLQMQNRDRGTAASVVQMQAIANAPDFDRLNASPIADVGAPLVSVKDNVDGAIRPRDIGHGGEITLPDGAKVKFRYAVVDAGSVLASHDVSGRANPDYGAPQSGQIVALTNGRVAGLQEAYARGTATAPGGYMDRLLQSSEQFGISQEAITDKEAPVLVRLYDDAVNARPDIGRMSNAGGSMRMSAQEVARNDARILPDVGNIVVTESGAIDTPENQPFIRGFVQALPEPERAEVLDKAGRLSQVGLRRIRNAIIHRAYGETSVFGRLVESLDSGMANLSKALVRAAPKVAKVKELMAAGAARDMDITSTLVNAVAELENMRRDGISLAQFLSQARLLDKLSPELVEVLSFLDANLRAPNRISAFIEGYYQQVEALGDQRTADMFGAPEVGTRQMLTTAAQMAQQEAQDGLDEPGASTGTGATGSEGVAADTGGTAGGEAAASVPRHDQPGAAVGEQPASPASGAEGGAESAAAGGVENDSATRRTDAAVDREGTAVESGKPAGSVAVQRPVDSGGSDAEQPDGSAGKSAQGGSENLSARTDDRDEKAVTGTGQKIVEELKRAKKKKAAAPIEHEAFRVVDVFGNGNLLEYYDDAKGLMFSRQQTAPGKYKMTAWDVFPQSEGGNQRIGEMFAHNSLEEAIASVRGARISAALRARDQAKYGNIPSLWSGEPKKAAKALIDAGIGIERFASSTQSKSKYIYTDAGTKIRLADHALPSSYDAADVDYRYGGDIKEMVAAVLEMEGTPAPSGNPANTGSRSQGVSEPDMQERRKVRADESGSSEEPAQSGDGAGSSAILTTKVGADKTAQDSPKQDRTQPAVSEKDQALADLGEGIDELISLLGGKTNMLPEEEVRIIPVMSKIFRAAAKLGYIEFKAAGRFVLEQIRAKSKEVADKLSIDNLQAGYVNIAKEIGGDKKAALAIETIDELMADEKSESANEFVIAPPAGSSIQQPAVASDQDSKSSPADPNARGNAAGHVRTIAERRTKQGNVDAAAHEAATSPQNDLPELSARRALESKNGKLPSAASEAIGIALAPEHRQALYAALKGKDLSLTYRIENTGETARLDMDAADALQKSDKRVKSLTQLLDCMRGG